MEKSQLNSFVRAGRPIPVDDLEKSLAHRKMRDVPAQWPDTLCRNEREEMKVFRAKRMISGPKQMSTAFSTPSANVLTC
jgi:hypothetical protein